MVTEWDVLFMVRASMSGMEILRIIQVWTVCPATRWNGTYHKFIQDFFCHDSGFLLSHFLYCEIFSVGFFLALFLPHLYSSHLCSIYTNTSCLTLPCCQIFLVKGFREVCEWYCLFHPSLLVYTYLNSTAGFLDLTSDSVASCIWVIFSIVYYIFSQIDGFIL